MNLSVILDVFWMIVGILLFGSWILGIYYQSKTRSPVVMAKLRQEGWWQVLRPTPLPPKVLSNNNLNIFATYGTVNALSLLYE